jgi:hypothetical protein
MIRSAAEDEFEWNPRFASSLRGALDRREFEPNRPTASILLAHRHHDITCI